MAQNERKKLNFNKNEVNLQISMLGKLLEFLIDSKSFPKLFKKT